MAKPKIYFKKRPGEAEGQLYLYYSHGSGKRLEFYIGLRIEGRFFNDKYWESNSKKPIKNNYQFSDQFNTLFRQMATYAVSLVVTEHIFDNE